MYTDAKIIFQLFLVAAVLALVIGSIRDIIKNDELD